MPFRGNELRLRREELGLSTKDLFRMLRIPLDVIEQIERGDMEPLPATPYSIGFIKTYCEFLDIHPEPYISELVMTRQAPKGILNQAIHGDVEDRPLWLREALMWATIIAIIVLGWATYSVVFQPGSADLPNQAQADTIETRVPTFSVR